MAGMRCLPLRPDGATVTNQFGSDSIEKALIVQATSDLARPGVAAEMETGVVDVEDNQ
jgi:hypothetical protein